MRGKQIMFHILKEDISDIIQEVETEFDVKYFRRGLFDNKDIITHKSLLEDSSIGFARSGDWNDLDAYLVIPNDTKLNVRDIPQRKGGTKYAVDQLENPKSVEIKLGGIYKNGDQVNIAGRIGTVSDDPFSKQVYKSFVSKIKKKFKRIGSFYIGPKAEEKLREGWRLVTNEKMSKDFDLPVIN
ncbi:hypothetical protein [Aquimarina sediminis]|uniref:hypothetical protein n=1 Tax=Aquimarina sediminis TaxID=2070536 RepID=UPI000CA0252D|nr:hypothetical protein [Aquimarina sediminis]